jgi:dephospho-CoA kinase
LHFEHYERVMAALVGVAGLAGAGKTTAVQYLAGLSGGKVVYLGEAVIEEVLARGLPATRENERKVRLELREQNGPAALAMRYADRVTELIASGVSVFVDAIFVKAEFDLLKSRAPAGSAYLLAIETSFDLRCDRLADRPDRPFSREELAERDKTELLTLGTGEVMAAAIRFETRTHCRIFTRDLVPSGIPAPLHERGWHHIRTAESNS